MSSYSTCCCAVCLCLDSTFVTFYGTHIGALMLHDINQVINFMSQHPAPAGGAGTAVNNNEGRTLTRSIPVLPYGRLFCAMP